MNLQIKSKGMFLAGVGLALAMSGCENGSGIDTAVAPGAEEPGAMRAATPYEKEVITLKSVESDPARLSAGLEELRSRFGFPAAPIAPPYPAGSPAQEASELAKAAAASKYFSPRTLNFGVTPTPEVGITVAANATVEAWTTRTAANASVDPVMVGFYRTSGDANSQAFKTAFAGYNDDNGNLDPFISWKNTTGAAKAVTFVAFAYSSSTTGGVTIKYRIVGGATTSKSLPMNATRIAKGSPNTAGCTGPSLTRIALQKIAGLSSETVALAYNASTKRGGYIYSSSAQLILEDVLPTTGTSFLIGYTQANSSGIYDGNTYKASQLDLYSCP
jgi:hypothetical protein